MKNYEIKNAIADYTGGGIHIYYGQLENDLYFRACDGWEYISICDSDTSVEDADYDDFFVKHEIDGLYNDDFKNFWNKMLRWIMENGGNDFESRLIPEKPVKNEIHERIAKLEQEILRLKRIEELQEFKEHMQNTLDVLMNIGCTKESVELFYNMPFTISFNGKSIDISNGHDAFQDVEYMIQREIDELNE